MSNCVVKKFNLRVRLNDGTVGTVLVNDIDALIHASGQANVCVVEEDDGNQIMVERRNLTFEGLVL